MAGERKPAASNFHKYSLTSQASVGSSRHQVISRLDFQTEESDVLSPACKGEGQNGKDFRRGRINGRGSCRIHQLAKSQFRILRFRDTGLYYARPERCSRYSETGRSALAHARRLRCKPETC